MIKKLEYFIVFKSDLINNLKIVASLYIDILYLKKNPK